MTALGKFTSAACLVGGSALLVGALSIPTNPKGAAASPQAPVEPATRLAQAREAAFRARPNIVVIMVDDMALSDLANMPNVNALIGDAGTTFQRSLSQYPLCAPSRATMLSGRYAHNHKVLGNRPPLGGFPAFADKQTLPVWLRQSGYRTMMLGKYLNAYDRPRYVPPGWSGWAALNRRVYNYVNWSLNRNGETVPYEGRYQTDALTDMATQRIRLAAPSRKPFFLWMSYVAPHVGGPHESDDPTRGLTPNVAPRHHDLYAGRTPDYLPSFNEDDMSDKPLPLQELPKMPVDRTTEQWQQRQEALMSVDESVAEIINQLRSSKALGNTIVAFVSDNGYYLGEHRLSGKTLPYEEGIRVPMLIRGPGFPAGVQVRQQTTLADLAPTFLRAAGARAAAPVDGVSLQRLVANPKAFAKRSILIEAAPSARMLANGVPTDKKRRWFVGVRTPREELYVEYANGEREYYDLREDPFQLRNAVDRPQSQDAVARLSRLLAALRNCKAAQCRAPVLAPAR